MSPQPESKKLYRSRSGIIFGVCEGLAEHFDLNAWGIRLIWVLLTLVGAPFTIIGYIALAFALKPRPYDVPSASGESSCSHSESLQRVTDRFDRLDQRLQRMETIVTRPSYELEKRYNDL
jgi:phage shock protein C